MASVFKAKGSSKYTILYVDETGRRRKKAGCSDKAVSERIAHDLENKVALRRQGLIDTKAEAYRDHAARPLSEHLTDWIESLRAKGVKPVCVRQFSACAKQVVALAKGAKLADINPGKSMLNVARAQAEVQRRIESATSPI